VRSLFYRPSRSINRRSLTISPNCCTFTHPCWSLEDLRPVFKQSQQLRSSLYHARWSLDKRQHVLKTGQQATKQFYVTQCLLRFLPLFVSFTCISTPGQSRRVSKSTTRFVPFTCISTPGHSRRVSKPTTRFVSFTCTSTPGRSRRVFNPRTHSPSCNASSLPTMKCRSPRGHTVFETSSLAPYAPSFHRTGTGTKAFGSRPP
jgi:hypothetical protein